MRSVVDRVIFHPFEFSYTKANDNMYCFYLPSLLSIVSFRGANIIILPSQVRAFISSCILYCRIRVFICLCVYWKRYVIVMTFNYLSKPSKSGPCPQDLSAFIKKTRTLTWLNRVVVVITVLTTYKSIAVFYKKYFEIKHSTIISSWKK